MRTNGGSARWPSQLQNEQLEHAPRAKPNFCALLFCKRTAGFPSPPESSTCRFDFWTWVILLILKIICFCYPNSFSLSIETVRSVVSPLFSLGIIIFRVQVCLCFLIEICILCSDVFCLGKGLDQIQKIVLVLALKR